MKAYNLLAVNNLQYQEMNKPDLKNGWALIKVKAAGICSSDIPRIFSKGTYHFPTIPGHEFSGIVQDVFCEEDKHWIGKRVGIFPLIPCKKCSSCKEHHYEMCSNYDYIGSRRDGAFAEYVAAPVWNLIELPDNISYETAAMLEPLSVALHSVRQTKIKNGDKVAVVGTGMIAFAAAQWAFMFAHEPVTILGRNKNKATIASKIDGLKYELVDENTNEYDVVIEAVGSMTAINKSISIVKPGGNLVLMGNPEGDITLPQNIYWRILRKQIYVVGTWNSAYECNSDCDWSFAVEALNDHKINVDLLITHRYKQDDLKKGLTLMLDHKEPYCKVMTIWNEE